MLGLRSNSVSGPSALEALTCAVTIENNDQHACAWLIMLCSQEIAIRMPAAGRQVAPMEPLQLVRWTAKCDGGTQATGMLTEPAT